MADRRPRRWRRVDDPRPVGIVHAPADRAIALRLLGDARSLGVAGVLLAPSGTASECASMWARVRALVLVHTDSAWWSDAQLADLAERTAAPGPATVAVARMVGTRYPPSLAGLPVLLLSGRRYKTDQRVSVPGHTFIAEVFGVGPNPTGETRRGYVFVSYRGVDAQWVTHDIVPALAEHGFGLFDYRGTEELDEGNLDRAHDRWLDRCAVVLVVATVDWSTSVHTAYELRRARQLGRPVVALRPTSGPVLADVGRVDGTVRFDHADQDGPALAEAIRTAFARSSGGLGPAR